MTETITTMIPWSTPLIRCDCGAMHVVLQVEHIGNEQRVIPMTRIRHCPACGVGLFDAESRPQEPEETQ